MTDQIRIPPHSIDSEQAVIGGLMLDPNAFDRIGRLSESDFYRRDHQLIFRAIAELAKRGQPCDAVTLADRFDADGTAELVGGSRYVLQLAANTPGAANIHAYAKIIRDKSQLRMLIDGCYRVAHEAFEPGVEDVAALLDKSIGSMMALHRGESNAEFTLRQAMKQAWDKITAAAESQSLPGIPTGLTKLDEHLGGFHDSDLIVIGARPSMGKTAMLFGMAHHAARETFPVGIVSGEQPAVQLGMRLLSLTSAVPAARMRSGKIEDAEWPRMTDAISSSRDLPVWVYDRAAPTVAEIARIARRWKREHNVRAVYIDYLQRLRGSDPRMKAQERVSEVAQGLKNLARELGIPVIALAQVKREVEQRSDKRPRMGDLCDSSEIEKEADVVLTLYRDEYHNPESKDKGTAEIIIDKNRHGETAFCRVAWLAETMRFADLAHEYEEQPKEQMVRADEFRRRFGGGKA